ncbi:MAG: hypothetical protein IKL56_04955 [Bacteroidaceae bacterium]|nr:hypothetical protein [Bacteroidaceae bacterium]
MCNRTFRMLRYGLVLLVCSCVDNNYDLNKEIATDVRIEGNRVSVPFGNLKAITLDSIVDVDDVDILEKGADGMYSISKEDSISPVEVDVDPVKLNVDPMEHSVEIDFESVEIDTVHIDAVPIEPAIFSTPDISLDELNEKLPTLSSSVYTSIENDDIKNLFKQIESGTIKDDQLVHIEETVVGTGTRTVKSEFTYELPNEVETIENIMLATRNDDISLHGTHVEVVITSPEALSDLDKKIDFEIVFPDHYELYVDNSEYQLIGNDTIVVKGMELKDGKNIVEFYIKEMKNIGDKIENGVISVNDDIVYNLDYKIEGNFTITPTMKPEDLEFNIQFEVPLAFKDVKGKTKDIEVDFESITMDFKGHFDDLEYVDTIYYIDFNEEYSRLRFESLMDVEWLKDFKLKDGYALKVDFPEQLTVSDEKSTYEGKGNDIVYDAKDHAFYVYNLQTLANTHWNLALDSLIVNVPVINHECDIDVEASVYVVDEKRERVESLVLAGAELPSMKSTLDGLKGEKNADFRMQSSDLVIVDADVHTEVIKSELDTYTDFTINEEIPEEIGRLEVIELKENVELNFELGVSGLEDLDEIVHLELEAKLPSFLKLQKTPKRNTGVNVEVKDDILKIKADVNPHDDSTMSFDLVCTGLNFKTEEFGYRGVVPSDSTDGKFYFTYNGEISISGDAYLDEIELHSVILEKLDDIVFDVNMSVDTMQVKTFHGLYRGEIDEVEESFDLDLGDELDFLKDDGNTITLAEPQIEIVLDNSIGVPIDVEMEIFGKDDNGNIIESSCIRQALSVKPAEYNEENGEFTAVETKLFLTVDSSKVSKIGYESIQVPGLAKLLEEKVPNSIDFKIKPAVNTNQTHHINILDQLTFSGSYAVYIPLKFDNLNIVYNDTIDDLIDSFGENLDMLTNIKLNARMDILNTIPLGLQLDVEALDMNGKLIESIEIEPVFLKAGLGGKVDGSDQETQKAVLAIKSATGDFSTLDKLALKIKAASDHTTGSSSLNAEQGVKISNIVFDIVGDIETDLDE